MYRKIIIMFLLSVLCSFLLAEPEISITANPSQIFVNQLNTGSFDPVNPMNQPILTTITISNLTQQPYKYNLGLVINWNQTEVVNVTFQSEIQLHPGIPTIMTNRDLINQNAPSFNLIGDINLTDIMEANPTLRDALQAGFFPDGTLVFRLTATPIPNPTNGLIQGIPAEASFSVQIKNINSIFLTYPGKPCGQTPSTISMRPATFLWNAVNTGPTNNRYRLVVKEFEPNNLPDPNSVETTGIVMYDQLLEQSMFSDFLPFQDLHYYAWQVSTGLFDENHPNPSNTLPGNFVKSEWFVFKYVADQGTSSTTSQQMMSILNMLNDPSIQALLAQGYQLTGVVIYEGQVYTGQDAVDLINSLLGKDLEIEITEQ